MLEALEQAGGWGWGDQRPHADAAAEGQDWGAARCLSYPVRPIGEELVDFWILAEKILSIDEVDMEVRDYYLSLLFMLKATHLQESSRVVTLYNMNISENYKAYPK